jgi:hypothetical protein
MGKYKEKNCKFCKTLHRKRGPYCCQACANRDRPEYSPKVAEAMRKVAVEYNRTPEAIAKQSMINTGLASLTADDFAVSIPDTKTLEDFYEHTEGFDRAEDW